MSPSPAGEQLPRAAGQVLTGHLRALEGKRPWEELRRGHHGVIGWKLRVDRGAMQARLGPQPESVGGG